MNKLAKNPVLKESLLSATFLVLPYPYAGLRKNPTSTIEVLECKSVLIPGEVDLGVIRLGGHF